MTEARQCPVCQVQAVRSPKFSPSEGFESRCMSGDCPDFETWPKVEVENE